MRPAVDVVVPVAADAPGVRALLRRLDGLRLGPGDTVTVVDNRGVAVDDPRVLVATGQRSSYYARNRGAARGDAPWILFLDADCDAPPDLLDRLLAPEPGPRAGVLAGAVLDEPPGPGAPAAVRYAHLRRAMDQDALLGRGEWAFAQTANCAVRRQAFAEAGGFREGIRSGGDADLCWRVVARGWRIEARPNAAVLHRSRRTIAAMLGQRMRHGSGAAWLARRHPGSLPPRRPAGLAWWAVKRAADGAVGVVTGDRDRALIGLLDGPAVWAFELGRLVPNRPRPVAPHQRRYGSRRPATSRTPGSSRAR